MHRGADRKINRKRPSNVNYQANDLMQNKKSVSNIMIVFIVNGGLN